MTQEAYLTRSGIQVSRGICAKGAYTAALPLHSYSARNIFPIACIFLRRSAISIAKRNALFLTMAGAEGFEPSARALLEIAVLPISEKYLSPYRHRQKLCRRYPPFKPTRLPA